MEEEKEKYLRKLLQDTNGIKILSEKLNIIISDKNFYKYGLLTDILEKLIENGYSNVVLSNLTLILDKALKDETLEIITMVSEIPGGKMALLKNIDIIYLKLEGEEILEFIDLMDDNSQKEIFNKNKFSYYLYRNGFIRASTLGSIIKGDLSDFVEEVIKEVSEGKKLEKLESGTYSDVIETNGYIIKLGETRDKFEIPYHPNILQPLLRERVTDKAGNDILIVEVQNKVDTKSVTEKKRRELMQELKKSKIKCRDILYGNIGILLKPNERRLFNGVGGIIDHKDIPEKTLPPGEPVIFDTDMIEKDDCIERE